MVSSQKLEAWKESKRHSGDGERSWWGCSKMVKNKERVLVILLAVLTGRPTDPQICCRYHWSAEPRMSPAALGENSPVYDITTDIASQWEEGEAHQGQLAGRQSVYCDATMRGKGH